MEETLRSETNAAAAIVNTIETRADTERGLLYSHRSK